MANVLRGTTVAALGRMTMDLKVLKCGTFEELKLGGPGLHQDGLNACATAMRSRTGGWL